MANLSITELLTDPDFVDPIQVVTRRSFVNSLGENQIVETVLDTVGSVQPADEKEVVKLPQGLQVADISSFFFKGTIVASAPGKYSSVLVFKGVRYQVLAVADFSNWGEGYTEGTAIAEVPA
jgi:hypothetical protein